MKYRQIGQLEICGSNWFLKSKEALIKYFFRFCISWDGEDKKFKLDDDFISWGPWIPGISGVWEILSRISSETHSYDNLFTDDKQYQLTNHGQLVTYPENEPVSSLSPSLHRLFIHFLLNHTVQVEEKENASQCTFQGVEMASFANIHVNERPTDQK